MADVANGGEKKKRLYVGNLEWRVREVHVIKLFRRFGKVVSLDFVWNKQGPDQGRPRGFCFVEFATREESDRAREALHDRVFFGRRLVVRGATNIDDRNAGRGSKPSLRRDAVTSTSARDSQESASPSVSFDAKVRQVRRTEDQITRIKQRLAALRARQPETVKIVQKAEDLCPVKEEVPHLISEGIAISEEQVPICPHSISGSPIKCKQEQA
mmetsp:Transcript_29413/g.82172  ORF Transcript_29413/g.82172 Transcript_29413/m.82172 type:complete len:213 (+) Transcript_29413:101-739(+)